MLSLAISLALITQTPCIPIRASESDLGAEINRVQASAECSHPTRSRTGCTVCLDRGDYVIRTPVKLTKSMRIIGAGASDGYSAQTMVRVDAEAGIIIDPRASITTLQHIAMTGTGTAVLMRGKAEIRDCAFVGFASRAPIVIDTRARGANANGWILERIWIQETGREAIRIMGDDSNRGLAQHVRVSRACLDQPAGPGVPHSDCAGVIDSALIGNHWVGLTVHAVAAYRQPACRRPPTGKDEPPPHCLYPGIRVDRTIPGSKSTRGNDSVFSMPYLEEGNVGPAVLYGPTTVMHGSGPIASDSSAWVLRPHRSPVPMLARNSPRLVLGGAGERRVFIGAGRFSDRPTKQSESTPYAVGSRWLASDSATCGDSVVTAVGRDSLITWACYSLSSQ